MVLEGKNEAWVVLARWSIIQITFWSPRITWGAFELTKLIYRNLIKDILLSKARSYVKKGLDPLSKASNLLITLKGLGLIKRELTLKQMEVELRTWI